jgi:hypothetical protein
MVFVHLPRSTESQNPHLSVLQGQSVQNTFEEKHPMRTILLALVLSLLIPAFAQAQTFEALSNGRGDNTFMDNSFEVLFRRTQVSAKYTESFGGFTFNMRWRNEDYRKGGVRWHFENPTLGDMLFVVGRLLKGDDVTVRADEQAFGAGFFGWHELYKNVVATDRLLLSVGGAFGDDIFASKRAEIPPGHTARTLDPAGYYFHLGPAFMATYVLGHSVWIDGYIHPDIGFKATGLSAEYEPYPGPGKYPRPIFLNIGTNVHHARTRTFVSLRFNHLIDRGVYKDAATRMDLSFGYSF